MPARENNQSKTSPCSSDRFQSINCKKSLRNLDLVIRTKPQSITILMKACSEISSPVY